MRKPVEIAQVQMLEKVVDMPFVVQQQVPGQPAEISQLPTVDKVAYIPVVVQ